MSARRSGHDNITIAKRNDLNTVWISKELDYILNCIYIKIYSIMVIQDNCKRSVKTF